MADAKAACLQRRIEGATPQPTGVLALASSGIGRQVGLDASGLVGRTVGSVCIANLIRDVDGAASMAKGEGGCVTIQPRASSEESAWCEVPDGTMPYNSRVHRSSFSTVN